MKTSNGSWKIGCTSRLKRSRSAEFISDRSWPLYLTVPLVGSVNIINRRARVVLPLPLSPAMAVTDGVSEGIVIDTLSSASVVSERRRNPPPKTFETPRNSTRGVVMAFPPPPRQRQLQFRQANVRDSSGKRSRPG